MDAGLMDDKKKKHRTQTGFKIPFKDSKAQCANCNVLGSEKKLQECTRCGMVAYCGRECQLHHWPVHKRVCIACKYSQQLLQLFAKDEDYQATLVGFKQQFEASDGGGRHAVGLICDSVATVKAMCDKDSLASGGVKVDIKDFPLDMPAAPL